MAEEIKPTTETVEAGGGQDDTSQNNTIMEIASKHGIDYRILIKLNPHLITTRRIHDKDNRTSTGISLKYKDHKSKKEQTYTVPCGVYEDQYALNRICARLNGWDASHSNLNRGDVINNFNAATCHYVPNHLIDYSNNQLTLAQYVKFDPYDSVITSFGSMTDSVESFNVIPYMVEDSKGKTIEQIAAMEHDLGDKKPRKISLKTLMELNPSISQTEKLDWGTIIVLAITGPKGNFDTVDILNYGIKADTRRTCFVEWDWDNDNQKTKNYEVLWEYEDSSGKWWEAEKSTTSDDKTKTAVHTADDKAIRVRVSVRPVLESGFKIFGSSSESELPYSDPVYFNFNESMTMLVPSVGVPEFKQTDNDNYKLTMSASVDISTLGEKEKAAVQFQVIQDRSEIVYTNSEPEFIEITSLDGTITHSCNVPIGHTYQVRARCLRIQEKTDMDKGGRLISSWSNYSDAIQAPPASPTDLSVKVITETNVELSFSEIANAEKYNAEYVIKDDKNYPGFTPERYFNTPSIAKHQAQWAVGDFGNQQVYFLREELYSDGINTKNIIGADLTGLATGGEYYIRVNAENGSWIDPSGWSEIVHFVLGTKPERPTTWSSTSTAVVGEPMKLYWIHNSKDESMESYAQLRMTFYKDYKNKVLDDTLPENPIIKTIDHSIFKNADGTYTTSFYEIDTSKYPAGRTIQWEVQTAGVKTDNGQPVYSDWSKESIINIYDKPVLTLNLTDSKGDAVVGQNYPLMQFPLNVNLSVSESAIDNHNPINYYVSIDAVRTDSTKLRNGVRGYSSTDSSGNSKWISEGDKIYAKHIDTNDNTYQLVINANDINLETNVTYRVSAMVSMNSGLSSDMVGTQFKVSWSSAERPPFADVMVDRDTLTTQIMPYTSGAGTNSVRLSVYRRNHDDSFTELGSNIDPASHEVVVDPHPPLDYARYRIVSRNQLTGATSYHDVPPVAIQEKTVIIQWDEVWQTYNAIENSDNIPSSAIYSGNMLKLPYNIDISNNHAQDVSHVRYIGRKRPVSYYGTHLGESASWNVTIPKNDINTLYALRRLAAWMGDVYVREPSGSGYWATISVSFSQTHCDLTIPVSLSITPVEGGK